MHYSAVQCSVVQCSAVQCSALDCTTVFIGVTGSLLLYFNILFSLKLAALTDRCYQSVKGWEDLALVRADGADEPPAICACRGVGAAAHCGPAWTWCLLWWRDLWRRALWRRGLW